MSTLKLALVAFFIGSSLSIKAQANDIELIFHNQESEKKIFQGQQLKILVWNIHKHRDKQLISDLQNYAATTDIMLIQEIHLKPDFLDAISLLPLSGHLFTTAPSFTFKDYPTGVANTSKYRLIRQFALKSPDREPFIKTPKMSLYSEYEIINSKNTLLVGNVHGINFANIEKFKRHMEQIFSAFDQHTGPAVLAGDFNSKTKKKTRYLMNRAAELGFELVPLEGDFRGKKKLDHIFVRNIKVTKAILNNDIKSSDHPALELTVSP